MPAAHKGDDEAAGGSPASSALPPPPFEPLPQLSSLTKAQPSPLLRWQLLELLYAYALAMRTYNGDCSADVAEAADLCVHIIPGLDPSSGGSGDGGGEPMAATASDAVVRCVARACRPPAGDSAMRALAVALLDDVAAILHNGRSNVVLALWDLKRLMEAARAEATADATATASSSSSSSAGAFAAGDARSRAASLHSPSASARSAASSPSQRSKKVLQAACRKLLFMAAWANEQPEQAFEALASAALDESRKQQQSLAVDSAAASRASVGSGGGGGGKIEQL